MSDLDFLAPETAVIKGIIVMTKRYDVDGTKGGSLWMLVAGDEENDDTDGLGVMKLNIPYALFDSERARRLSGEYALPCQARVIYATVAAGGNKLAAKVVSIDPITNVKFVTVDKPQLNKSKPSTV